MLIEFFELRNFRKLRSCRIDLAKDKTVFVGANNSGKTSAMDALILFLKERNKISMRDFTLSNWKKINAIGKVWAELDEGQIPDLSISQWGELLPPSGVRTERVILFLRAGGITDSCTVRVFRYGVVVTGSDEYI